MVRDNDKVILAVHRLGRDRGPAKTVAAEGDTLVIQGSWDALDLTLMWAPTSVVLVSGLAIAKVSDDKWLRFVWPLLMGLLVVATAICAIAAAA
jgi:uncharacterized ion transporter superfamily protein YfcC